MPGKSSKLSQIWQELKRRRVIHVITMYASATFVIIELINNLTAPLNLPSNLATIVIIVLAVGFPLVIILSWLYDLTSEGIEKTKSLSEIQQGEKTIIPNAWKIATYVSFIVIIGLVTLNVLGVGKQLRAADIQSMLILPFENFTGDDQLDWFTEGMHASLIHDMGRISGFDVLNRTSSSYYKNVGMTLQEMALELDRDIVIKSEVMCLGDTLCLGIEMIRVFPVEEIIWIAEYREAKNQIPNLYNRLTKQIAEEAKVELSADEEMVLAESRTVDTAAYNAYINGLFYLDKVDPVSLKKASRYFNRAAEIDPDWAPPYAGLAMVGAYQMQMSFKTPLAARKMIYENLNKAIQLNPNSADSHYAKANIAVWTEWDWEKGEKEFTKSIELNPSNALVRMFYAHLLHLLHRWDEAIQQADLALKLDPYEPFILGLYGVIMRDAGNYQSAIEHFEKALSIDPNHRFAIANLASAYSAIKDYEKWFEGWKRIAREVHDDEVIATINNVFHDSGYRAAIEMIIKVDEEAINELQINIMSHVSHYLKLNNCDKAMDWLEKGYEIHNPVLPFISVNTIYYDWAQLKENPRYIKLLKKMDLPLPED